MEKFNFNTFPYGAIDPALLLNSQEMQYASPHNSVATPMHTPLLDPSPTPYTPFSASMEDFSQGFIKQEELTPSMGSEQDMAMTIYLLQQEQQSHYYHPHQNGPLFPDLDTQPQTHHPHACHVCGRSFSRKYNLNTHIRTHDKHREKPYGCPKCPKRFDRRHDCKRHFQTVHEGLKTHPCNLCSSAYSRKDALTRHKELRHPNTSV